MRCKERRAIWLPRATLGARNPTIAQNIRIPILPDTRPDDRCPPFKSVRRPSGELLWADCRTSGYERNDCCPTKAVAAECDKSTDFGCLSKRKDSEVSQKAASKVLFRETRRGRGSQKRLISERR